MTGLRELLDAATGGSDAMRASAGTTAGSVTVTTERAQAREALRALAPELAALVLDMGEELRGRPCVPVTGAEGTSYCPHCEALARLDRIVKEEA